MPELQMPKLSDTMTEGTLVAWKKKKGEKVAAGEVLAEIETDKATMEGESPEDGTLTEIYVDEGGKVEVGQRIAFIGEPGESADKKVEARKEEPETARTQPHETEKPAPAKAREKETAPPQEKPVEAAVPGARTQSARLPSQQKEVPTQPMPSPLKKEEARIKASPVARRLADELGVELGTIQGTGPDGRIIESD